MEQTLVLNVSYEPLAIVHWTRAMTLLAKGACEIVAESDVEKRAVSFTFRLPAVVRLLRYIRSRARREHVPFTRANTSSGAMTTRVPTASASSRART